MGILLRSVKREQLRRGMVIVAPGSIKSHKKFIAQLYILKKEEGGRHTPFMQNYQPQMYLRTADVTVTLKHVKGVDENQMIMPGDSVTMDCEVNAEIAMEKGMRFTIREGGKTVGTGMVVFFWCFRVPFVYILCYSNVILTSRCHH